ncbi:hypothetical protein BH20ACI4_BH20ACI4_21870 [soil metagenome]
MFKKSKFSRLEQILLLIPTSFIPALFFIVIIVSVYESYFPPEPTLITFEKSYCCGSSTYEFIYGLLFLLCISISFFLLLFKRVSLSWLISLAPIIAFAFVTFELIDLVRDLSDHTFSILREDNIFFPFPPRYIYSITFIIFLFLWHTKILIQDKIRSNQNINLP